MGNAWSTHTINSKSQRQHIQVSIIVLAIFTTQTVYAVAASHTMNGLPSRVKAGGRVSDTLIIRTANPVLPAISVAV